MPGLLRSPHPASFPDTPDYPDVSPSDLPPKIHLKGSKSRNGGIFLSWNASFNTEQVKILKYEVYVYKEVDGPVNSSLWRKLGDVQSLPLPIGINLSHLTANSKYHFGIRAIDTHHRFGPFSNAVSISF